MVYATFISPFGTQLQKALKRYPFGGARSVHDQKDVSSYLLVSFQSLHCNDLFSNNNKVFSSTPHPSLRDTFAPQAKALTAVQLFIQKTSILYPFVGLPRHFVPRNDIIAQKIFICCPSAKLFLLRM